MTTITDETAEYMSAPNEDQISLAAPSVYDEARIFLQGERENPDEFEVRAYLQIFTSIISRIVQEECQGEPA